MTLRTVLRAVAITAAYIAVPTILIQPADARKIETQSTAQIYDAGREGLQFVLELPDKGKGTGKDVNRDGRLDDAVGAFSLEELQVMYRPMFDGQYRQ